MIIRCLEINILSKLVKCDMVMEMPVGLARHAVSSQSQNTQAFMKKISIHSTIFFSADVAVGAYTLKKSLLCVLTNFRVLHR